MGDKSAIAWTEGTWNPSTGCSKKVIEYGGVKMIDPACENCYMFPTAKRMQAQVKGMYDKMFNEGKITSEERDKKFNNAKYRDGSKFRVHWNEVDMPLRKKKPKTWFVDSMSDIAHEQMPLDFYKAVFETMNKANWHTFQVLTKRPDKVLYWNNEVEWSKNIWMGTSVGSNKTLYYIDELLETGAQTKFLSMEPIVEEISLKPYLENLEKPERFWVITGGESPNPKARPIKLDWIRKLRDECQEFGVPFFYKQFGETQAKCKCCGAKGCRVLDGRIHDEYPTKLV